VDDLAGEEHFAIGEPLARLIGVVDGAIDAVAEAELPREVDGQTARPILVVGLLDRGDEVAVITLGEDVGDLVFEVETFSEDQRWQVT
jgi:hypothetical protein